MTGRKSGSQRDPRLVSAATLSMFAVPVDGKKLFGLSGIDAMVRIRHHLNNSGEDSAGEDQFFSSVDADPRTTL